MGDRQRSTLSYNRCSLKLTVRKIERQAGNRLRDSLEALKSKIAGVAQLVEHNVANVVVVGSNPIARSLQPCRFFLLLRIVLTRPIATLSCNRTAAEIS